MICEHKTHQNQPGIFECSDCNCFIWGEKGSKRLVPWINESRLVAGQWRKSISPAKDRTQQQEFNQSFMIRSRLYADLDYIVDENIFLKGKELNSKKKKETKYQRLSGVLEPFGLKITRLVDDEGPNATDPFVIHRIDVDPFQQVFPKPVSPAANKVKKVKKVTTDERWNDWKSENIFFSNGLDNPFFQQPKPEQFETIKRVLENPGSLTIAALPTGFGKTRIVQIATYLLRKNHLYSGSDSKSGWSDKIKNTDQGPTLIISPLVALMDDQREKWTVDFNELLIKAGLSPINCRFLTTGDATRDPVKMEQLRNNELDVLCCSPEDLMDPKRKRNHWLETFARMKVPFSMMVVDEAHIIGSWGATIRPQFQLLSMVKNRLLDRNPNLRVLLMSATISMSEEKELIRLFSTGLRHDEISDNKTTAIRILKEGTRPDLYFDITYSGTIKGDDEDQEIEHKKLAKNMFKKLNEINLNLSEDWNKKAVGGRFREDDIPSPILTYTPYPGDADTFLKKHAIEIIAHGDKNMVKTYTGKTNPMSRQLRLKEFVGNKVRAMIATSAFGMGVDKPDVWLVSYFGMPYSLSDLYQGFGRAARHSDWYSFGNRKSGYCLGVLHGSARSFKPRMQLPLTTERFWDMLFQKDSYVTGNGFLVIDISSKVEQKYWSTTGNDKPQIDKDALEVDKSNQEDNPDEECSDGQQYDMFQEHLKNQSITISSDSKYASNFDINSWEKDYSKLKKVKELLSLRLWSLACLQREGKIELLGFHPPILFKKQGRSIMLKNTLEKDGYSGVIEALNEQGLNALKTPEDQNRLVVIQVKSEIKSFTDFKTGIKEGLNSLKNRHSEGKKELQNFLKIAGNPKSKGCYRQLFAKTIGLVSEDSCIVQIKNNLHKPRDDRIVVMPCSKCRQDSFFSDRGLTTEQIMMSTGPIIQVIRDGSNFQPVRKERKKKDQNIMIGPTDKVSQDEFGYEDQLEGDYNFVGELYRERFNIIHEDEIVGALVVNDNRTATITTKSYMEWGFNKIIIENGNGEAELKEK